MTECAPRCVCGHMCVHEYTCVRVLTCACSRVLMYVRVYTRECACVHDLTLSCACTPTAVAPGEGGQGVGGLGPALLLTVPARPPSPWSPLSLFPPPQTPAGSPGALTLTHPEPPLPLVFPPGKLRAGSSVTSDLPRCGPGRRGCTLPPPARAASVERGQGGSRAAPAQRRKQRLAGCRGRRGFQSRPCPPGAAGAGGAAGGWDAAVRGEGYLNAPLERD